MEMTGRELSVHIREQSKQKRMLQQKTIQFYREYVTADPPKSDEEARELIMERLASEGLTERKMKRYLERPGDVANPKAMALSDAKLQVWLQRTIEDIDEIREECDSQLEHLDGLEGEDWYEVEETDATGGIKSGTTTRKRKVWEERQRLLERRADATDRFFTAYKNLYGNNQSLTLNLTGQFSGTTLADLTAQIAELEKKNKIGGVSGQAET